MDKSKQLVFDKGTHTYSVGGVIIPHTTKILAPLQDFSMITKKTLEVARQRGSAVHEATAFDDNENLDEATIDPVVAPYLFAWRKFKEETKFEPQMVEVPVYHKKRYYGTTPDRIGKLARSWAAIEIKATAILDPVVALQLAAQQEAFNSSGKIKVTRRLSCLLKPDGTYRLQEWKDKSDIRTFYALLQVYNWKIKHQKDGGYINEFIRL